jgi:NAD(P)-dependent dehydrogenase (short-subunit alcohol dehydrogenase family)
MNQTFQEYLKNISPKGLQALEVVADLTLNEDCKRLIDWTIDKFGKIDILVNTVGLGALIQLMTHRLSIFMTVLWIWT